MNIGYVGLGHMGGALALRLQLSHVLNVYDLQPDNVKRMTAQGCLGCSSNREIGEKCDIVLLSLQTSHQVREAIFGADGLASGLSRGAMIIDQTTGDAHATRQIARELEPLGIALIDAPVSGGPPGAAAGTIAIMVGGTEEQFKRAEPVLRAISSNVVHTGELGTGQVIKLANNMLNAVQRLLTFEVMCLAVKNGATAEKAWEVMVKSSGRNFMLEHTFPRHILNGKLAQGFTLGLMHKDVLLAKELADKSEVPMVFGSAALAYYRALANEYGRDGEVNLSVKTFERNAKTRITPLEANADPA